MSLLQELFGPTEDAQKRCEAFQQLSEEEKFQQLCRVIDEGWRKINESPNREAILRELDEEEEKGHQAYRDLFARFGV